MLIAESSPLLDAVSSLLKPHGLFIWSGILFEERRQAVKIAETSHLSLASEKRENEWWCGVFRKAGTAA
jgi:ribosomal protein L11 methylase PrmA